VTTSPPNIEDTQQATGGDRRRWLLLAIAVAVIAIVAAVLVLGGDDGGDDADEVPVGAPRLPDDAEAPVDQEGEQLVDLLAAGRELTYHATYRATDPESGASTVEVWRRDRQVRTDTEQVTDDGAAESATFVRDGDPIVSCTRTNEGPWSCTREEADDGATGAEASDTFFGTYAQQLRGQDVAVEDDEIDGRSVRCFRAEGTDGEVSFCITPEGLPVRLRGQGAELVLTDLSDEVPDDVFTPPDDPESAGG
jgi:hypothetical protein